MQQVPCLFQFSKPYAVSSLRVLFQPLRDIDRLAVPAHFESEIKGDGIELNAFGGSGGAQQGRGCAGIGHGFGDAGRYGIQAAVQSDVAAIVGDVRPQPGKSAEAFPFLPAFPILSTEVNDDGVLLVKTGKEFVAGIGAPRLDVPLCLVVIVEHGSLYSAGNVGNVEPVRLSAFMEQVAGETVGAAEEFFVFLIPNLCHGLEEGIRGEEDWRPLEAGP